MVVAGVVASDVAAHVVSGNDRQSDRQAFTSASVEIASTLRLALQHEEDLVLSARGFIVGNPSSSQGAFQRWTTAVDALARYPELEGGGEVVLVPAQPLRGRFQ